MVLRRFTQSDADLLVELDSDPEVMRYLHSGSTTREEVETSTLPRILGHYERHPDLGYWVAIARDTEEFLGWFELGPEGDGGEVELGYRLRRAAWGKGYATEGSRALLHKAFTELAVPKVFAETMSVNRGSRRVMEKVGLKFQETFYRDWPEPLPGSEHGEVRYAVDRADWLAAH